MGGTSRGSAAADAFGPGGAGLTVDWIAFAEDDGSSAGTLGRSESVDAGRTTVATTSATAARARSASKRGAERRDRIGMRRRMTADPEEGVKDREALSEAASSGVL